MWRRCVPETDGQVPADCAGDFAHHAWHEGELCCRVRLNLVDCGETVWSPGRWTVLSRILTIGSCGCVLLVQVL